MSSGRDQVDQNMAWLHYWWLGLLSQHFEHKKNQINLHKISSFLIIANSIGFFISVLLFLLIVGSNRPSVHCGPFQMLDLPLDAIQNSTNEIFVHILRQIFRLLTSNIFLCFLLFTLLGYVLTMRKQFMGQCHEMRRLERLLVLKANKSEWISLFVGYYYIWHIQQVISQ